jgi:hypothetical protein
VFGDTAEAELGAEALVDAGWRALTSSDSLVVQAVRSVPGAYDGRFTKEAVVAEVSSVLADVGVATVMSVSAELPVQKALNLEFFEPAAMESDHDERADRDQRRSLPRVATAAVSASRAGQGTLLSDIEPGARWERVSRFKTSPVYLGAAVLAVAVSALVERRV